MENQDELANFVLPLLPIKLEPTDPYDNEFKDLAPNHYINNNAGNPGEKYDDCFNINWEGKRDFSIFMDVMEPLTTLRSLLEEKTGVLLQNFYFTLQDTLVLEDHKNLVEQCIRGEGIVQIIGDLKYSLSQGLRINIADILIPIGGCFEDPGDINSKNTVNEASNEEIKWSIDSSFKKVQKNLEIPEDFAMWSVDHVLYWISWAAPQFNLSSIKVTDWNLPGSDLLNMSRTDFKKKVPLDPFNSFWTHFELLRKRNIVATCPSKPEFHYRQGHLNESTIIERNKNNWQKCNQNKSAYKTTLIKSGHNLYYSDAIDDWGFDEPDSHVSFSRGGSIKLWQFLLELLTDRRYRNAIQWCHTEGEFVLVNPHLVAHLWGIRKNNVKMNYENFSRALRYYNTGDLLTKVPGQKFVYKFVCDLKQLIGYCGRELNALVIEAEAKAAHLRNHKEIITSYY